MTDVSFAISDGVVRNDDVMVADFIDTALDALPLIAIKEIVDSGGVCFFLLGLFSENNLLCDFSATGLSRMASHGMGLKLDFYGGEGP
ncbi:hypothetical protein LF41_1124 [Lysobacter dokdonensis DS-58]|uniref:Uncharacterized protein n=1 Tax=Lysobacter dokdonensis DS-58 TaxID=1300345 RepID=A0A0A2WPC4_9GAMM|nr:hypothetical protein LF41_1124 [Lysobacter dokdonensis DS-58]